jgi:hypothetical protein
MRRRGQTVAIARILVLLRALVGQFMDGRGICGISLSEMPERGKKRLESVRRTKVSSAGSVWS